MKQLILILSLTIVAFIAACSDSNRRLKTSPHGSAQKTLADLEKASSDEELKKLKAHLEKANAVQIPDVVSAVKKKFGKSAVKKDHFKEKDKDKKQEKVQKPEAEEKVTNPSSNFDGVELVENDDPSLIITSTSKSNDVQTKHVCIKTCDVQIIIRKTMNPEGKLTAIEAFVGSELKKENSEVKSYSGAKKTLESILASYDANSDSMNLKLFMTRDGKELILTTENYIYKAESSKNLNFSASDFDSGKLEVKLEGKSKVMRLDFDTEGSKVNILLKNDLGLFGKNAISIESGQTSEVETIKRF